MPWREGHARVFPSLEYIQSHFTEFWNLLSFDAVQKGSLDEEFGSSSRVSRRLDRVLDRLFNAELPLQRNSLHIQLRPIIQTIFEDIAKQDRVEILQSCYVHAGSLRIVGQDLDAVITDSVPRFLKKEGTENIIQRADDAGSFGTAVIDALTRQRGQLYLLLGGIGSGKSTFIKRYQRTVGKPALEDRTIWFHLDFLEGPADPSGLESFAWQGILDQLRSRLQDRAYESRKYLKRTFADKIEIVNQTTEGYKMLRGRFEKTISPYLERWQAEINDYVPRLLRVIRNDRTLNIVLFT